MEKSNKVLYVVTSVLLVGAIAVWAILWLICK